LLGKKSSGNSFVELKNPCARFIALIACVHLLGGHWMALQTVAWIGMFATNAQEAPLSIAIEKTFDGKHPCPLCEAVESGREQERNEGIFESSTRLIAILPPELSIPLIPFSELTYFRDSVRSESVAGEPHSPPPQQV
jgi:hypothetical protein